MLKILSRMEWILVVYIVLILANNSIGDEGWDIEGVFSLTPVLDNSCLSILVPCNNDEALYGIRWFNNDGTLPFQELILLPANLNGSPVSGVSGLIYDEIYGNSYDWSEYIFNVPIVTDSEAVLVVFVLPEFVELSNVGNGGGPGFGYVTNSLATKCYISSTGDGWVKTVGNVAFDAIMGERTQNAISLTNKSETRSSETARRNLRNFLRTPAPNPNNPITTISLYLSKSNNVELDIFNIRGERVSTIFEGYLSGGDHSFKWLGVDGNGRKLSSGVYLIRLAVGNEIHTQRVMILQ